jgi:hypothetical protein
MATKTTKVLDVTAINTPAPTAAIPDSDDGLLVTEDSVLAFSPNKAPALFDGVVGGIEGEDDFSDIRLPRLQIVQGVGPLSQNPKFRNKGGAIVFAGEDMISDGAAPVHITVIKALKDYEEKLPDGEFGTRVPRRASTQAEVTALGGTLLKLPDGKGGTIMPSWRPCLTCLVAVEGDSKSPHFPYLAPNGKSYGIAIWKISGWSYSTAGKAILTAAKFAYRDTLLSGDFSLSTKYETFGKNSAYVCQLSYGERHDTAMKDFLRTFSASI